MSLSATGDGFKPIVSCAHNSISLFLLAMEVGKTNHDPTLSIIVILHQNEGFAFGEFLNGA